MQEIDVKQTILIVVGSDLKPEEKDRPIAYALKKRIEQDHRCGKAAFRKCVVISDLLFQSDKIIQACPTISIGGPGVNEVAAQLVGVVPLTHNQDNRFFIHYDESAASQRVLLWGIDHKATAEAVEFFISHGLAERFLSKIWN